ncbi:MAG TPA: cache domain-containing protein [Dongiaceae bacterium]|nr:cache domain-containing protein [Dongiaceae bacterium]
MVAGNQVVDIGVDPRDAQARRRRAWLRVGIPIVAVVLMIAAILAIAVYSNRANRQGVLALSDDLLAALDSRIALEVSAYLDPAARAVRILRGILKESALARPSEAAVNAATVLREVPQVANLSFADQDGNYILVRRRQGGGTEAKVIENAPGPRRVTWIERDATGAEIGRRTDPTDSFDPRQRPWYKGAAGTDELFWTGAYVFYTDRQPGITVSARYVGPQRRLYVYGVDISLGALSRFLASLQIGGGGKAVIMDADGRLIATPTGKAMIEQAPGNFLPATVDSLADPPLTRAYDQYRTEGPGRHIVEVNGTPYILTVTPLATAGRDWFILIAVPEEDFVGFIANNNRRALIMSLVIVLLAAVLAGLLVRQGLRADRSGRLLLERQRTIGRQSAAFARIAAEASLFEPGREGPPAAVTETLIETTGGRRASVWRLGAGGRSLRCEDSYERDGGGHAEGLELQRDELPRFMDALLEGEAFRLADAESDRRTSEFYRAIMQPFGSRSLLLAPIRREDRTVGAILVEDAPEDPGHPTHARDFVLALAHILALRLAEASPPPVRPLADRPEQSAEASGPRSFAADLRSEGIDPSGVGAELYPDAVVMVLQLTDPAAMALRLSGGQRPLSDEIVRRAQKIAKDKRILYLKLVGHELYAAAGLGARSDGAPMLVADAAISLRDACRELFEEANRAPAFRIGIDCGLALGSTVGGDPEVFNLWGDAVRTADAMARSAPPGAVQATEAAYRRLREDFLFRPRGRFYLPRVGEAQTFILAGRA